MQPRHISHLLKEKLYLYNESKRNSTMKKAYKEKSKQYDRSAKQRYNLLENAICRAPNSAKFYGYVNKKFNVRSFIPTLQTQNNKLAISDEEKVEELNKVFQNVLVQDNGKDLTRNSKLLTTQYMEDVSVSDMDVFSALHRLSGKLSRTPDKLPAYFIKRVAYPLLYVLTYLFNLTLSSGTLPTQWQCSIKG